MSKIANYFISKVRFNTAGTHIDRVIQHDVTDGNNFGEGYERSRSQVIDSLKTNVYYTIFNQNGWNLGSKVHHVKEYGKDYISTDPNETKKDNLDNLPTF
jgi:hypothetical protein